MTTSNVQETKSFSSIFKKANAPETANGSVLKEPKSKNVKVELVTVAKEKKATAAEPAKAKREQKPIDPKVQEEALEMLNSGKRPTKPDQASYGREIDDLERELADCRTKLTAARRRIEEEGSGGPQGQQLQALRLQLKEIKQQQQELESNKASAVDTFKAAQDSMKRKQDDLKALKDKLPYKSPQDIDRRCAELDAQVSTGQHKLIDEKRMLSEITALRKQKKQFEQFIPMESAIDAERRRVDQAREAVSTFEPEVRRLRQAYGKTMGEIKALEVTHSENKSKRDVIYNHRNELQKQQEEIIAKKREVSRVYYAARDLYNAFSQEDRKRRDVEFKKEREEFNRQRQLERLQEANENAAIPAFESEIKSCNALIKLLHNIAPVDNKEALAVVAGQSENGTVSSSAKTARKANDAIILPKGFAEAVPLKKKTEEEDVIRIGGKSPKQKQQQSAPKPQTSELKLDLAMLDQFWKLKIDAPTSRSDVPKTVDALLAKRAHFIATQDKVTEENMKKAAAQEEKLLKELAKEEENDAAN